MLLRLISLQMDNERGRWKNREPRLDPDPLAVFVMMAGVDFPFFIATFSSPSENTSSSVVVGGKLTLRDGFADVVDDVSSPDISAL